MGIHDKYGSLSQEEIAMYELVERKFAYADFICELENGDYEGFEPTDEQIEKAIDAYIESRHCGCAREDEIDDMRAAIDKVRRNWYEVEVHYLAYAPMSVLDVDEKAAHLQAKNWFTTMGNGSIDGFIRVVACGTNKIGGEEIDNDNGEHTTEWD